jgi:exodeoxyribonuclease VII small subunit
MSNATNNNSSASAGAATPASTTTPAARTTSTSLSGGIGDELAKRTFEDLVSELETVAAAMDRGDIGIEEAADLYSRAAALHAAAHDRLTAVQARLATLRTGANA